MGSQHAFASGQILNPYLYHYSEAFAFSRILYRHLRSPPFRADDSASLGFAPGRRKVPAYHVPHDSQIDRVRTSLCTEWVYRCVGSLSILTDLPTIAILALGPKGGSSPALLTIRNAKTSLTLSIPTISQGTDRCATHRRAVTECLEPCRCRQRTLGSGTGDTTP